MPYLRLMIRRKWIIAGCLLLGMAAGIVALALQTPIYEARVSMEVQNFNQEFLDVGKVDPTTVNYEADSYLQTQIKMIQSDGLLDRVVLKVPFRGQNADAWPADRPSFLGKLFPKTQAKPQTPREKAIRLALSDLRVRGSGMTRLIEVYCDGIDPQFAADFCNTLATEYLQQSLEVRWNSAERVTNWLTEQLAGMKKNLEGSEDKLNQFTRSMGMISASDRDNVAALRLTQLQDEMLRAQADRVMKQSKFELLSTSARESLPEVLDDVSLRDYQMRFVELRRQYAELSASLTANHPQVKKVEAQLRELDAAFTARRSNIIARIRNEYETACRREALLGNAYAAQAKLVSEQTTKNMQFTALKRDVDTTREMYDSMLRRFKEAGVAAAMRVSNIRVVDQAKPPEFPSRPNRSLNLGLGLTGGLLFGLGFVFFRENLDSRLNGPGDAKYYLNLPELGLIPAAKVDPAFVELRRRTRGLQLSLSGNGTGKSSPADSVELVSWQCKQSLAAESYRSALTSILFWGERENGKQPQVVLITSPGPQDGKTTTITNLGISLAVILSGANRRVLLIDADLRRPRLHRIFGLSENQGLCELLRDPRPAEECPLDDFVRPTDIPGLWILPSGNAQGMVASLIHSERLTMLLARLRREFHAILLDAPPMLYVSDARVLARRADSVILVVRAGHTSREVAMLAREQLQDDGNPLLGTILNDWNPKKNGNSQSKEYVSSYNRYYRDVQEG
jgi:polysaccharide biosynthesis transport protein